jgi:hypothetical protein
MWKKRIHPEDITINISKKAKVPECPKGYFFFFYIYIDMSIKLCRRMPLSSSYDISISFHTFLIFFFVFKVYFLSIDLYIASYNQVFQKL